MSHINQLDQEGLKSIEPIFQSIAEGNAILFLGAGASVSGKKYLGNDIMTLYEESISKTVGVSNLIEFVDILSADKDFNRPEFDTFVFRLLEKLKFLEMHKIIVTQPWRKIITTNQDLLIEQAYDSVRGTAEQIYELRYIRNAQEYQRTNAANEIEYIKLNGCISDRKIYPLVYSTEEFVNSNNYYKLVMNEMKSISDSIKFISVGYSYDDLFSKILLEKFDKFDFRARRTFYTVDPYVNDSHLNYLEKNQISIIKVTAEEFFNQYKLWEENNAEIVVKTKRSYFYHTDSSKVNLPAKLTLRLSSALTQLNEKYKYSPIEKLDFYKGEEPNYGTILKEYDVVRSQTIKDMVNEVKTFVDGNHSYSVPVIYLKGEYGSGKTTIAFRLMYEWQKNNPSTILFEVVDYTKLSPIALTELFSVTKADYYIFFFNYIERNSVFSSLLEFRNTFSSLQIESHKIIILTSIRENILERFKLNRTIKNSLEISVPSKLTEGEISSLLDNLKDINLINFRDEREKRKILSGIKSNYNSDTFITLLETVPGIHYLDLIEAINNLPQVAKDAVIYISALHQFNILMPVGLLRALISKNWEIFRTEFLTIDCKSIIIKVEDENYNSRTDLFFRTKHPIIAKNIIDKLIPNKDDQFKLFSKIFSNVFISDANSRVVSDLLRSIKNYKYFNLDKLNKLYDTAYPQMSDDPYFLLYYSISLQNRNTLEELKRAITLVLYAETFFKERNHKFIHRRAVLNFQIAKYIYEVLEKTELRETYSYLSEAEELFKIKYLLDPCSFYSFCDYLLYLIWKVDFLNLNREDDLRIRIRIEELLDLAEKTVFDGIERVLVIKQQYISKFQGKIKGEEYIKKLQGYYEDENFRPLALILMYNFFEQQGNTEKLNPLVVELEYYNSNDEVGKFLFKYYGRNLQYTHLRVKFYDLLTKHPGLENPESLRYNFFMFIADCYNQYIHKAYSYLDNIKHKYQGLHPDYKFVWKENDSELERIFNGIVILNKKNYKKIHIVELQQSFYLEKNNHSKLELNTKVKVRLNFYLYGIRSEIVAIESTVN
jgi:hypothetical protein